MNKSEVLNILNQIGVRPNKNLGQNFLIDKNTASKMIIETQIKKNQSILEIGPGLGALTENLVKNPNQIYAYEIDTVLHLFNEDILKAKIHSHDLVISNIPYTITGPIFEKVFYTSQPPRGALIIENSIAERLFNKNTYKNFSRITVTFNAFMKLVKKFKISRFNFFPVPRIELSLVIIEPRKPINQILKSNQGRAFFLKFVAGVMPFKNKNLVNAIKYFLKIDKRFNHSKQNIEDFLNENQIKNDKLAKLDSDEIIELSRKVYNFLNT
ncbi:MAG: ribosomal RNA small subunit methyltransferase A [Promethearchaeota archaeon]